MTPAKVAGENRQSFRRNRHPKLPAQDRPDFPVAPSVAGGPALDRTEQRDGHGQPQYQRRKERCRCGQMPPNGFDDLSSHIRTQPDGRPHCTNRANLTDDRWAGLRLGRLLSSG